MNILGKVRRLYHRDRRTNSGADKLLFALVFRQSLLHPLVQRQQEDVLLQPAQAALLEARVLRQYARLTLFTAAKSQRYQSDVETGGVDGLVDGKFGGTCLQGCWVSTA